MPEDKSIREGKFFAIISYIGFFCIVSLLLKKDNKFALYHAKHGLILFVSEVGCFLLSIIPFLTWLMGTVGSLVLVAFSVWGIFQAYKGKYSRIILITKLADKIIL